MYAHITEGTSERERLERDLDEPLPSEMTSEERALAEIRRVADANRAAVESLRGTAGMRVGDR